MRIVYEGKRTGKRPERRIRASGGELSKSYVFEPLEVQDVPDADASLLVAMKLPGGAFRRLDGLKTPAAATPTAGAETDNPAADKPAAPADKPAGGEGDAAADKPASQPAATIATAASLGGGRQGGQAEGGRRDRDERDQRPAFGGQQGGRGGAGG